MSGAMRKMGVYLGLFEEAEGDEANDSVQYDVEDTDTQLADERPVANLADRRKVAPAGIAATPLSRITTLHPRTYNEARVIGENFRDGVFAVRGSIERVTNKVFLLSPPNVSVTAEEKARIAEGGFFNQS